VLLIGGHLASLRMANTMFVCGRPLARADSAARTEICGHMRMRRQKCAPQTHGGQTCCVEIQGNKALRQECLFFRPGRPLY
jgi:hypothetical protein